MKASNVSFGKPKARCVTDCDVTLNVMAVGLPSAPSLAASWFSAIGR